MFCEKLQLFAYKFWVWPALWEIDAVVVIDQHLAKLPRFGGLILGCIEGDFEKDIFVSQHFATLRYTRFAHFFRSAKFL